MGIGEWSTFASIGDGDGDGDGTLNIGLLQTGCAVAVSVGQERVIGVPCASERCRLCHLVELLSPKPSIRNDCICRKKRMPSSLTWL